MPVREMVLMTVGLAELLSPAPQLHQRSVKTTKTLNLLGLLQALIFPLLGHPHILSHRASPALQGSGVV